MEKTNKGLFISNVKVAMFSQLISLAVSVASSLILPKFMGVEDFSYYQLFIFYITYVGFACFGLNDGIYLKEGGKHWNELDKSSLKYQWYLSTLGQAVVFGALIICVLNFENDTNRIFVFISTGLYGILECSFGYFSYIFQATNNIKLFSISSMIERIIFFISIISSVIFNLNSFHFFIYILLIAKSVSLIILLINAKDILNANKIPFNSSFKDMISNMKVGLHLMIANIASLLILGFGRFLIDFKWGINAFGKFSFSMSLANFFLLFINRLSLVIFPTLKRLSNDNQKKIYFLINKSIFLIGPLIYLCYLPLSMFVYYWLPNYYESIIYLAILLPMCIFEGKMNLLYITYFKAFRLEKYLLKINILTLIVSIIMTSMGVYVFQRMNFVVIGMIISLIFRCVISELIISSHLNNSFNKELIIEMIMAMLFIFVNIYINEKFGFILILTLYAIILFFNKKYMTPFLKLIKKK